MRAAYPDQLISVDTWRSEVARLACRAGADLINDTWGGVDPRCRQLLPNSVPVWCAPTPGGGTANPAVPGQLRDDHPRCGRRRDP
ncbi:pterin binding enzyme family protein [Mycobacterium xenopi 4042]|uniref:Pterin binding enzyme family protein n=1 Tax=Mycobacterium xenopi 4042 TaxID=1299334 RepID=X8E0J1_MYCXE|nr:pterin binding enzyme family protein [Mycobacterium xenopi 4042]